MSTRHVLIVDDLRDVRQLLRSALETLNLEINIVDVPSGEEAMLVISRQKFDLLVSDVRLAGISGLDLVRKVRKGNPSLKVILITGMPDSEIRQQVADFGADTYFYKPIEIVDFQKAVLHFLNLELDRLPEPPAVREEPVQKVSSLPERLDQLRRELAASCVWVVDSAGKTIIRSGELPGGWERVDWKAVLPAAGTASLELARSLRREFPENYLYISGREYDLHAVSLGWVYSLLAAVPHPLEAAQVGVVQRIFRESTEILNSLTDFLPAVSPALADEPVVSASSAAPPAVPIDTGELAEVFRHAGGSRLDEQDIDEFWDSLAEEQDIKKTPDTGSISYDQARKLGLTPGE